MSFDIGGYNYGDATGLQEPDHDLLHLVSETGVTVQATDDS